MKRADISDVEVVRAAKALHDSNVRDSQPIRSVDELFQAVFTQRPRLSTFQRLHQLFPNHPTKVIYAAMFRSVDNGLVEYGVSVRWCFPTDKGLALLAKYAELGSLHGRELGP